MPDDFISPILRCQSLTFQFPGIAERGLSNYLLAQFGASMAGINYVLGFIPPSPQNLPSIPSINLFLQPAMASLNLPSSYPSISLGPLTIPGQGEEPYEYDLSGEMKLLAVGIVLPFMLIKGIVEKIISDLKVALPTFEMIAALFGDLCAQVGLAGLAVTQLGYCLALGLFELLTAMIPV